VRTTDHFGDRLHPAGQNSILRVSDVGLA
jgi:hypothetical protein